MTEDNSEAVPHRRLIDKINAAASHALEQGRREIAVGLKKVHDALIEQEIEEGYPARDGDKSDLELNKWLDKRYKSSRAKKRVRPGGY